MSGIPPAVINVVDPVKIGNLEFISQVLENIAQQLSGLEVELGKFNEPDDSEITVLAKNVKDIRDKATASSSVATRTLADANLSLLVDSKLNMQGETLRDIYKWLEYIKELEHELKNGEYDYYRIVSDLLSEVLEMSLKFYAYRGIPYVAAIFSKVDAIQTELKRQVQWSFREIGPLVGADPELNPNAPRAELNLDMKNLTQVYLVVDVLGYQIRVDLLERFAQLQLISYEKAFQYGTKYCGLDALDRRYIWFRYLLKVVDENLGPAFPRRWCVTLHLFAEFSRRTRKHLSDLLTDIHEHFDPNDNQNYVNMILSSLKSILNFEAEIKATYAQALAEDDEEADHPPHEAIESVAEAFDPFLGPYVTLRRDELDKLMFKLNEEESRAIYENRANDETGPYESSRQMFEFIKTSLKRCTAFSTGVTYLSLSREYRICLHNYAESLKFRCPSPVAAKAGRPPSYVITPNQEVSLCRLVCTGEYCIDTIPPLEAKMKEHVKPMYRDEVDFNGQIDAFVDMITFTFSVMISGLSERLEPAFKAMRKINWASVENVGDESPYVKEMRRTINECIPRIRGNISKVYFQNFTIKLSTAVLDMYNENIWNLKRIGRIGAGQLLLDLNSLKTYLRDVMPQYGLTGVTAEEYMGTKSYRSFVAARIEKIENILKLVCAEEDQLVDMFKLLWPEATQADYDAVVGLQARTGLAAPLDHVGGIIRGGAQAVGVTAVGKTAKDAVGTVGASVGHGISSGARSAFGGISHAAGDIKGLFMGASLFDDSAKKPATSSSSHGNGANGQKKPAAPSGSKPSGTPVKK